MDTDYKLWTEDELQMSLSVRESCIPYVKGFTCMKNRRQTMEDRAFGSILYSGVYLYAVLDGHGGKEAVEHFTEVIPKNLGKALSKITSREQVKETVEKVFLDADEQWYDQGIYMSGTTFTGVLIFSREKKAVYLINLGDSRTVLCLGGKTESSEDHKPCNPLEEERISKAGR